MKEKENSSIEVLDSNKNLSDFINETINEKLTICLGSDNEGKNNKLDLNQIPHLLIFGPTGSGKSVFLDTIITTLLLKNSKKDINFILMDPKKVELGTYNNLPHLMYPVISDAKEGIKKLIRLANLIDVRKDAFVKKNVKNINQYNKLDNIKPFTNIIIVIDESCDIMKETKAEQAVLRILKDGALAGIHIILATNSYYEENLSKKVINKADYKISFDLLSKEDADLIGVESANISNNYEVTISDKKDKKQLKVETPYISDEEINKVVKYINEIK